MEIRKAELGELQVLMTMQLREIYPPEETMAIVSRLFSHHTGLSVSEMLLEKKRLLTESEIHFLQLSFKRLKHHEPLQYVIGTSHFCGFEFKVDPAVLIPRRETEELVDWIYTKQKDNKDTCSILDIGTGSGCIAISLKKKLPLAELLAVDLSEEALSLAEENAALLDAEVSFKQVDILDDDAWMVLPKFNIIVSNPPYVTPADREKMLPNVSDHEPPLALFVDEDDPLLFYREIIDFSTDHLLDGGSLYFECNEGSAREVTEMLKRNGFKNIELRKDMQGKERMVLGVSPSPRLRRTK